MHIGSIINNDEEAVRTAQVQSKQQPFSNSATPQSPGNSSSTILEASNVLDGFPRVARVLASGPDESLLIVRRFRETSIRNLLLLQARVAALESVQRGFDDDDHAHSSITGARIDASRSWEHFALLGCSAEDSDGICWPAMEAWMSTRSHQRNPQMSSHEAHLADWRAGQGYSEKEIQLVQKRWQVAQSLQLAIKDYGKFVHQNMGTESLTRTAEALIRHRQLLQLEQPVKRTASFLARWLETGSASGPQFSDSSAMNTSYKKTHEADQVTVGNRAIGGLYARWFNSMPRLMGAPKVHHTGPEVFPVMLNMNTG